MIRLVDRLTFRLLTTIDNARVSTRNERWKEGRKPATFERIVAMIGDESCGEMYLVVVFRRYPLRKNGRELHR